MRGVALSLLILAAVIFVATLRLDVNGLDADRFKDRLERFLNMAAFWSGRIAGSPKAAPEADASTFLRV